MTETALQRLKAAGWTSGRKVDITPIEEAYADAEMEIPPKLREFFEEFGFLSIEYDIHRSESRTEHESHWVDPRFDFHNYGKEDFEHLFDDYGVFGSAYPVGSAFRGNMTIYYHDDGNFYVYMACCGPLIRCGHSVESFLDGLLGDSDQDWEYLDE